MELKGKTALVTGASRGLGKAIALKLAQMGANIIINYSTPSQAADETVAEFREAGYPVLVSMGDVSSAEYIKEMVKQGVETFGNIDFLVNNAGITRDKPMLMMSEQDWDDVMNINLKSAFLCTKAVAKLMIKQKCGKIVNITSVAGVMGNAGQANYASSKAGLIGLTKTTAKELAVRNIQCNAIAPGVIQSRMTDVLPENVKENYLNSIPLRRFGTPEDVANMVGFLLSDQANYITGQVIHIDGGLVM